MEHFDNNNFDDFNNHLPEDYGWDNMREDIYEKMDRKTPKSPYFWSTIGLSSILLISTIFFFANKNSITNTVNNSKITKVDINTKQVLKSTNSQEQSVAVQKEKEEKTQVIKTPLKATKKINSTINKKKESKDNYFSNTKVIEADQYKVNTTQESIITFSPPYKAKEYQNFEPSNTSIVFDNYDDNDNNLSDKITIENVQNANNYKEANSLIQNKVSDSSGPIYKGHSGEKQKEKHSKLHFLPLVTLPYLEYIEDIIIENAVSTSLIAKDKPYKKLPFRLAITASVNQWSADYDNALELGELRNSTTTQLAGYNVDVKIDKYLSNSFYVGAEAGYHTWNNRLNSEFDYDTVVTLKDVVISKEINAITGEVTETTGDISTTGNAHRKIVHYNTFSGLRIGGLVGYSIDFNRWSIGAELGSGILFALDQKGRRLDGALNLTSYNATNSAISPTGLTGKIGVNISYKLNEIVGMGIHTEYETALTNWGADDLNVLPNRLSLGARLQFTF
ncbi:MAG: hypothetical protein V3V14_08405 [Saprospiraceae bacterium]